MAYDSGTSNSETRTSGVGLGYSGGGVGIGIGGAKSKGVSTTLLAAKVSPPLKKLFWLLVLAIISGLSLLGAIEQRSTGGIGFWAVLFAIGAWFSYRRIQWNRTQYPQLFDQWEKSWVCHKCGHLFHLDLNSSALSSP